jgi:hypothetical protein
MYNADMGSTPIASTSFRQGFSWHGQFFQMIDIDCKKRFYYKRRKLPAIALATEGDKIKSHMFLHAKATVGTAIFLKDGL